METVLGERGFRLSGGERQRIALARALLAPCSVLITDEATSALDGVTADLVHQAVRRHAAGRALIIVAHRIPQLAPGDHVLCLEDGRVAERGSYAALQRPGSRFSRLLQAQRADTDHEPPRPHTAPATATALAGAGGRETP
jgi:ABC-type multidrug transport system fused ATPase/permease subunit